MGVRSSLEMIQRLRDRKEGTSPSLDNGEASAHVEEVAPETLTTTSDNSSHKPYTTGTEEGEVVVVQGEGASVKDLLKRIKSVNLDGVKEDEGVESEPIVMETKKSNRPNGLSQGLHPSQASNSHHQSTITRGLSLDGNVKKEDYRGSIGLGGEPTPQPKSPKVDSYATKEPDYVESKGISSSNITTINQEISSMSRVPASLGMESVKIERDSAYAIAFCNPHIRRLLKHYKDDPFWSAPSREIINLCLMDTSNSFLDPASILAMVGGMSDSERSRAIRMGIAYNQMTSPAEASIAAKSIIYRMRLTRIHHFIREYDSSSKSEADVDLFIQNIIYVSKHYGLSMEVESLSELNLSEIFPEDEFSEGGLRVFPSFFAPLNDVLGYNGYLTGQLVTVAGAPARGKTTFLFNEAVNFALSGRRVLYFALADQDKADLILKFLSIFYGYRFLKRIEEEKGREALIEFIENTYHGLVFPDAYADVGGYHNPLFDLSPSRIHARNPRIFLQDEEVQKVIQRIDIVVETEVRPHIQDIQATVMSRTNEPDVIIIDYDRSIKARTTEGLYQEGEEIYDGLVALTKPKGGRRKLVIVASQINKGYWHLPDPPLQSLAESSRKQAISDIVITIGKNLDKSGVHEGFISLVKNRRGPTGKFGYFLLPTTNMVPWSPEYVNEERRKAKRRKREDISQQDNEKE